MSTSGIDVRVFSWLEVHVEPSQYRGRPLSFEWTRSSFTIFSCSLHSAIFANNLPCAYNWTTGFPSSRLPVLVWIFGGGFEEGGSTDWDPVNLTTFGTSNNLPTVVVTLNYRLSGLGFAALPELANVSGNGNFGLLDQRLALEWVQRNIDRFGGDPLKVSIWGQSAGAQSVCFHLLSPGSRGLFRGAVSSSGPAILPYPTITEAEIEGSEWASRVGCTGPPGASRLACLRRASLAAVHAAGSPRLSPRDGFLCVASNLQDCLHALT